MRIRTKRHPSWLKVPLPAGENFNAIRTLLKQQNLHTVCQSAHCPNIGECWNNRTATFMILGDICTRSCRFCAVKSGYPETVDFQEPGRVAAAVKALSLRYTVITSVTRDDLQDGGAFIFAECIKQIHQQVPGCAIEVLIPDFRGDEAALDIVISAKPDVLNHNLETVPRLYAQVRPQAEFECSMQLLKRAKDKGMTTKTGLMLGLGEEAGEILDTMVKLRAIDCDILTLGQYLQPSAEHLPIHRYITPEEFDDFKHKGLEMGFRYVESGPLVRSSYHAASQQIRKEQ